MKTLAAVSKRVLVKAAFWVPVVPCLAVAWTPNPTGVVASASGGAAHVAVFAYLAVALFPAHFRTGPVLAVGLWLFAFGVLIELVQFFFVDGRSGELLDLVFDAAGIAVGCAGYCIGTRLKVALV